MNKIIYVKCPKCLIYYDEEKVKFINIEEDIIGYDVMTFVCPKCKKQVRSRRLG